MDDPKISRSQNEAKEAKVSTGTLLSVNIVSMETT